MFPKCPISFKIVYNKLCEHKTISIYVSYSTGWQPNVLLNMLGVTFSKSDSDLVLPVAGGQAITYLSPTTGS